MKNKILSIFVMFILLFSNIVSALDESTENTESSTELASSSDGTDIIYPDYNYNSFVSKNQNSNSEFNVGLNTGAAIYEYSFEIPSGINGLQPGLKISYNSQSTNSRPGIAGAAWTLSQSYIQRDAEYSFNDSSDDTFELILDGASYDLVYNKNEDAYHTQIESYLYIKKVSGGKNDKGEYWIIKSKEGLTYRFGYNKDSELVSNQHDYVVRWSLDLVTDTYDNNIYYTYKENPNSKDLGAVYPYLIEYNNDKKRKVEFIFKERLDVWTVYEQGNLIRENERLDGIIISYDSKLIRRYKFDYTYPDSSINTKGFLKEIKLYGSSGEVLPPVSFSYYGVDVGWEETNKWASPISFKGRVENSKIRFVDFNRDGFSDILYGYYDEDDGEQEQSWLNDKNGNWIKGSANIPFGFSRGKEYTICSKDKTRRGIYRGFVLAELNGDGLIDYLMAPDSYVRNSLDIDTGLNKKTYLYNGYTWKATNKWLSPEKQFVRFDDESCLRIFGIDEGIRVIDLNGDGYDDIIKVDSNSDSYKTWINNRIDGWNESELWKSSFPFVRAMREKESCIFQAGVDLGVRFFDVNGDGLVDEVVSGYHGSNYKKYNKKEILINNGKDFIKDENFNLEPPGDYFVDKDSRSGQCDTYGEDRGRVFADVNGDGLTDILVMESYGIIQEAWINNGHGWSLDSRWNVPYFEINNPYTDELEASKLVDVNGDGLVDFVRGGDLVRKVWLNKASKGYLLKEIKNDKGGKVLIDYEQSNYYDNKGDDGVNDLGFNIWVVKSIISDNGMQGPNSVFSTINYFYKNGLYDYEDKEFRGFNYVEEILSDKKITHYFYQDDTKKGSEYKNEIVDKNNNPYKKTEREFSSVKKDNYYIVHLDSTKEYSYDGSTNPKTTKTGFNYDEYGNVIKTTYYGDELNGDERYEDNEYLYNTDKWIIKLKHTYLLDANSKKITETFFSYDKQPYNANPVRGSLTQTEYWLEGSNPKIYYDYDEFGNVILKTDSSGYATKYEYDNAHTFIIKETNALGQASSFVYESGTGNLLSKTDANGYKTEYKYDNFGRIIKEIQLYDSEEYPTIEYSYEMDGSAPEKTITRYRIESGKSDSYDEYYFYDGFGNLIQSKKESDNKQIINNVFYDENGRVKIAANPFFAGYSPDYTINKNIKGVVYSYDPMDRVLKVKDQKGNENKFEYDKRELTITDKNGNKKRYYYDAYGNIMKVKEYNGNENYETDYLYNSLNQIIEIGDDKGNRIIYEYDSLGRKTGLKDPDMGILEYWYDKNGNLVKENNNGIIINFEYDKLNRLIKESSPDETIYYEYDSGTIGKLSKVKSSDFEISYVYDKRYRLIEEKKIIDGVSFTTKWSYDSMDRVLKVILPDGKIVDYTYSGGELKKISGILNNIDYNEQGQITKRDYTNGLISGFDYDQDNFRLKRINTGNYQDLRYKYDNAGNMIEISNPVDDTKETMEYDELDRLTKAERIKNNAEKIFSLAYYYDSIGNIIEIASEKYKIMFEFGKTIAHAPIKVISVGENEDNNEDNKGDNRERKDILTEPVNETKESKIILHRTIRDCSTKKPVSGEQIIEIVSLSNGRMSYNNYKCNSRYEEQCITDGSFDTYYDEWCKYQ